MERGLISVDRWSEESQAYFLTHLHADHTRGLSSSWARGPVFCSPVTASLLTTRFPGFDLSLLKVLPVGTPRSLKLRSRATGEEVSVRVTAVDSCHCPGSVMFLFQGDLGCVLYSGDFRWEITDEKAWKGKKTLLSALGGERVDVLYLDNTFCNPTFDFPPRGVAARQVIDLINDHPAHEIVIGIDTLGKEDLLVLISEAIKTKVWVWPERLQTMHLLGLDHIFTTNTQLTRIRAIPRYSFSVATLQALNTIHPTIGIMPSGLPWTPKADDYDLPKVNAPNLTHPHPHHSGHDYHHQPRRCHHFIFSVLYSAHSCYREIGDFIQLVRPIKISGTVPSSSCYVNPWHFFGHLCSSDHKPMTKQGSSSDDKSRETSQRKRKKIVPETTVKRSRVCLLRKIKCGAKISD